MIQPTRRHQSLGVRQSIEVADSDEACKSALESSREHHLRLTKTRIVKRLASIEESVAEVRRWAQKPSHPLIARSS